jgi:hypothetical protein
MNRGAPAGTFRATPAALREASGFSPGLKGRTRMPAFRRRAPVFAGAVRSFPLNARRLIPFP